MNTALACLTLAVNVEVPPRFSGNVEEMMLGALEGSTILLLPLAPPANDTQEPGQEPRPPFVGAGNAGHLRILQIAAVKLPVKQLVLPETSYPVLQVGWHADPEAKLETQVPIPPFAGAETVHREAVQVAAIKFPTRQLELPEIV
jgi:hypothetical protein